MAAHYHIRWSSKELLDWEPFDTRTDAEARAAQLVRSGETFTIEECDETCPRCTKTFHYQPAKPHPTGDYPWQQAVRDAVDERDAHERMRKISKAQSAISVRLTTMSSAETNERAAIRDALRTIRALTTKRGRTNEGSANPATKKKKEIA